MPRVKAAPVKRKPHGIRMEQMEHDDADQSVLDDDEVKQIEAELASIRRRKAEQIQKLRRMRDEKMQRGLAISSSSSDSDGGVEYEEDVERQEAPPTSARQLANGLETSQQRFMFSVKEMEKKYTESERLNLPESRIEMDMDGNLYFPESIGPQHQQKFVNKLFLNDARFGKGLVSAPLNSIDSFDGDVRALRKCQELDAKFGRRMRRSGTFEASPRRKDRVSRGTNSEYTLRTDSTAYDRLLTETSTSESRFQDDYDDNDVFTHQESKYEPRQHHRTHSRHPTTSTMASFFANEERRSESDSRRFADDEEYGGESESSENEESSGEEYEEEEENTPVAARRVKTIVESREITPIGPERKFLVKKEPSTSPAPQKLVTAKKEPIESIRIKAEPVAESRNCRNIKMEVSEVAAPSFPAPGARRRTPMISSVKEEPHEVVMLSDDSPHDEKKNVERNRKITDFLKPLPRKSPRLLQAASVLPPTTRMTPRAPLDPPKNVEPAAAAPDAKASTPVNPPKMIRQSPRSIRAMSVMPPTSRMTPRAPLDLPKNVESASAVPVANSASIKDSSKEVGQPPRSLRAVSALPPTTRMTPRAPLDPSKMVEPAVAVPNSKDLSALDAKASTPVDPPKKVGRPPGSSRALSVMPASTSSERPTRNRKPTSKAIEARLQANEAEHSHFHDHQDSEDDSQPSTSAAPAKKKQNKTKEPVCKHCEYIKEQKKQARLSGKLKKAEEAEANKATPKEPAETKKRVKKTPVAAAEDTKETPKSRKVKEKSPKEESSGTKRRSATVVGDEPEMKKKKLTEMDLLSIPSSMAVVVDTELIASENSQLVSATLPKFSTTEYTEESIWSTSVASNWLTNVRKAAPRAKDVKLFGVSVSKIPVNASMISVWASNIQFGFDKDPFESDLRRLMAQDKQERLDVKAGYDFKR